MPGERGRRARRRAEAPRAPLAPLVAWVGFAVLVTGGVLVAFGVAWATVAWVSLGALVVGGALVAAAVAQPPAPLPAEPEEPLEDDRGTEPGGGQ